MIKKVEVYIANTKAEVGKQLSLYGVRAVLSLASYIKIAKHMLQSSRASVLPAERFIDSVNNTESPVFMVRQCL